MYAVFLGCVRLLVCFLLTAQGMETVGEFQAAVAVVTTHDHAAGGAPFNKDAGGGVNGSDMNRIGAVGSGVGLCKEMGGGCSHAEPSVCFLLV